MTAAPRTGTVLAIGNFDGVHLGHQALIRAARAIADDKKLSLTVLTFQPHPKMFFMPDAEPFLLTRADIKKSLLQKAGADHVEIIQFDANLASLSAEDFLQRILIERMDARHIVVGEGFHFGHGRKGDAALIASKIPVTSVPLTTGDTCPYSSTAIRTALKNKDFQGAAAMLGRPWEIVGEVVHGDKRGRTLGYPTANQKIGDYLRLPFGIYAVKVLIPGEATYRDGVANFGIRPMFEVATPLLETYIFDYDCDLYDKTLHIRPVRFLRGEMAFDGLDALVTQIKEDCQQALQVLKSSP